MREVCGIVFIYRLYFKEPVINFGRVGKDDFFLALWVSIFYVLYSYAYFFQKMPNMDSVILTYGVTYKPTMFW